MLDWLLFVGNKLVCVVWCLLFVVCWFAACCLTLAALCSPFVVHVLVVGCLMSLCVVCSSFCVVYSLLWVVC